MKVVFLHPPLYPVNYHFYNLIGGKIELIVYQFGDSPSDHQHWNSKKLSGLKKSFKLRIIGGGTDSYLNQLNFRFIHLLKIDNPDIVLSVAFWLPSLFAILLKSKFSYKFIITTDAIPVTEKSNSKMRELMRSWIAKQTDMFISASELTTNYIKSLTKKKDTDKIFLSRQTIDIVQWREKFNLLEDKLSLRKKLGLPGNKNILLGVGNFTYKKNWISVLKSMGKIEDTLFVLIGSGKENGRYTDYIKNNSLENKVKILGRKEGIELIKYFKASDLFIFPSMLDQYGFVVLEALASDLPVLCTLYSGASVLIQDGFNGYVMDSKKDFTKTIERGISEYFFMKENAYLSIKELTLENRAKEFVNFFNMVFS